MNPIDNALTRTDVVSFGMDAYHAVFFVVFFFFFFNVVFIISCLVPRKEY